MKKVGVPLDAELPRRRLCICLEPVEAGLVVEAGLPHAAA